MYNFLLEMTRAVMGSQSVDIPINEIPLLLGPMSKFLDIYEKSEKEKASRKVYFSHFLEFKKRELQSKEVKCNSLFRVDGILWASFDPGKFLSRY